MNRVFRTNRPIETTDETRWNTFMVFDADEREGESPQSLNSARRLWICRRAPWAKRAVVPLPIDIEDTR
jgi:hypothetical protein